MYCDRNGTAKQLPINQRATSIARSCNNDITVYGDVFIGRCHDDESLPWNRLDFSIGDLNSDAPWILKAQQSNKGKSMNSFNTSGALQNILQQHQGELKTTTPSTLSDSTFPASISPAGNTSWLQTADEVEVRVSLVPGINKKELVVSIRSQSIQLSTKSSSIRVENMWLHPDMVSPEDEQLMQAQGAPLWAPIDSDSSTWTLEQLPSGGEGDARSLLCISLCKQSNVTWKRLLK